MPKKTPSRLSLAPRSPSLTSAARAFGGAVEHAAAEADQEDEGPPMRPFAGLPKAIPSSPAMTSNAQMKASDR